MANLSSVLIVGQGGFLNRAIRIGKRRNWRVFVWDTAASKSPSRNAVIEIGSGDPNAILDMDNGLARDLPVICANNPWLLAGPFLKNFHAVYNLHNSDVRASRGYAEFCLVNSLLDGIHKVSVSTQRIEAGNRVDQNPTLRIRSATGGENSTFESLYNSSISLWEEGLDELFADLESDIQRPPIALKRFGPLISKSYLYRKVKAGAYSEALDRFGLGNYAANLGHLQSMLADFRALWRNKTISPKYEHNQKGHRKPDCC